MSRFYKYQGTGNDFVILDNRDSGLSLTREQIEKICHRRFGIGADGLMLLESSEGYDFAMKYYNADGKEGTMCGNGGRCLTQFAHHLGLVQDKCRFIAIDGPHDAEVMSDGTIALHMSDVAKVEQRGEDFVLNTGSPHYVKKMEQLRDLDVFAHGRSIRYNAEFTAQGININFIEPGPEAIFVRTYERGVEDETYSCGTGVTAVALVSGPQTEGRHRVEIDTLGGHLSVTYTRNSAGYEDIWLQGPAVKVFEGDINPKDFQ